MANTDRTPTVGALAATGTLAINGQTPIAPAIGALALTGVRPGLLGSPVVMDTGLRPMHAWLEGLAGEIVTIRRGGSYRVHLVDSEGRFRAARVKPGEVA